MQRPTQRSGIAASQILQQHMQQRAKLNAYRSCWYTIQSLLCLTYLRFWTQFLKACLRGSTSPFSQRYAQATRHESIIVGSVHDVQPDACFDTGLGHVHLKTSLSTLGKLTCTLHRSVSCNLSQSFPALSG